jgi:hypothetical protein
MVMRARHVARKRIRRREYREGKHKGYIDANSGLAGGIYTAEKAIPVKLGRRKAFCSQPSCFLNIVEINQLSLNPSHGARASGKRRLPPQAERTSVSEADSRVRGGWEENAPAGGCESGGSKIMRTHGTSMKYALVTKDRRRSSSA